MTRSRSAGLVGRQGPRVRSVPSAVYSDGADAIELGRTVDVVLDPWQEDALVGGLGVRKGGGWSASEVGLLCPRQNGKNEILVVRELAGLLLFGERLLLHSAHEYKTAQEAFLRVQSIAENYDEVRRKVKTIRTSHGEEGIYLISGQRLRFVARSKTSGRGFTGDVLILDEAQELTDRMMGAMLPTLSARSVTGDPQTWYAGSAGDETAFTWARIRQRGHDGSEGLAFFEWAAGEDADLDDPEAWAEANPALGVRIATDAVRRERETLSDADFARERLGIWPLDSSERAIPAEAWDAVCYHDTKAKRQGARVAIEVAPDHSLASFVAWDGRTAELVAHRPGITWVVDKASELKRKYGAAFVVDGNGPAAFLVPAMEDKGVEVERLANAEVYAACASVFAAVADGHIRVRAAVEFDEGVAAATKKTVSGDRFVWRRDVPGVTPFVALTLAFGSPVGGPVVLEDSLMA